MSLRERFEPLLRATATRLGEADGIVPPTGFTAWLTVFSAAAMAFLAVFALSLSLAAGRLADRWDAALDQSLTVRISAPDDKVETEVAATLAVLGQTPGVESARRLDPGERMALIAPWLGAELPLDTVPLPELIDVTEGGEGIDIEGLRLRLAAEAPNAVLDDHARWRRPLVEAAERLRGLGVVATLLIAGATAAMIALAAQASLSANRGVIEVLRLVGASDRFIAGAFVRRFTLRALVGASVGAALGALALALLPGADETAGFLSGLAFQGAGWLWVLVIPPIAALVALAATAGAARRVLREMP